jgi:hypothetical protein
LLYLVYDLHLTPHALGNREEFWAWVADREPWFFDGLGMVEGTWWLDFGPVVQHLVLFADESRLADYRAAVKLKREDPAWEARRRTQDLWYTVPTGSRVATDPPVSLGVPVPIS